MSDTFENLDLDESLIDLDRLYRYRLERVQAQLAARDLAAILTYDPVYTRYATGVRNMQPWSMHTAIRMGFIPVEGPAIVFEYAGSEHLGADLPAVAEVRPSVSLQTGPGLTRHQREQRIGAWLAEVQSVARERCGNHRRVAVDNKLPFHAAAALQNAGFELHGGYEVMALAQNVKNEDELRAMQRSIDVAAIGIERLRARLSPGVTENELWAVLNHANIEFDGEYMDTRLLSSGPRTNPWYQESGKRVIQAGDMVALDTDMIGPYGYDADVSRSFVCEPKHITDRQRAIYELAKAHVRHNMALLRPGRTFRELSEAAFEVPEPYRAQTISMNWHGVSLYGGWPTILGRGFFDETSEDGVIEAGMTLCVESYIGEQGGPDGVKFEEQVLVTETGCRVMSSQIDCEL